MSDHLTEQQMNQLQEILNAKEIASRIRTRVTIPERTAEGNTYSIADVDESVTKMALAELADIAAARQRISKQQYGICIECGAPIDYARLQAYVTAKRCADCQSVHEQRHHLNPSG